MIKVIVIIAMLAVATSASLCKPEFFGSNGFLQSLITFELLNILAVILTVTLASIANIHLSLSRISRLFRTRSNIEGKVEKVRSEITQDGWLLVLLFVLACGVLFLKGHPSVAENIHIKSFANSLGAVILLTNLIVLFDLYQVIYKLVRLEGALPNSRPPSGTID